MAKTNSKHKLAAAYAAALLPKGEIGVTGSTKQDRYLQAIEAYGDHADAAATILQACALANINDNNRRAGQNTVLREFERQMEYFTGEEKSRARQNALGVVEMAGDDIQPEEIGNEHEVVG